MTLPTHFEPRTKASWLLVLTWLLGCTDGEAVHDPNLSKFSGTESGAVDTKAGAGAGDEVGSRTRPSASDEPLGTQAGPTLTKLPKRQPKLTKEAAAKVPRIEHAIIISVDGLASRYLELALEQEELPAFARLRRMGALTLNARTDADYTYTLPNHTCMLTGLPVKAPGSDASLGHGYTSNGSVTKDVTLHNSGNPARSYIPSVFDVAHDRGLRTALFASKSKFSLYANSYNAYGAEDQVGSDDGPKKIDVVVIESDLEALTDALLMELQEHGTELVFVHYNQPDQTGHSKGWGSDAYMQILPSVDQQLGRVLDTIGEQPELAGKTALALTTDHGGTGYSHLDATDAANFVIPFFVVAPGVAPNSDLYALTQEAFVSPTQGNPSYTDRQQPIRNGYIGNLALELLGLPVVPGSIMHSLGPALLGATTGG